MKAPDGLGERGSAFWGRVDAEFQIGVGETELLLETCRTLDLVERLEQALDGGIDTKIASELRQQRLVLGRLLAQLKIPLDELETGRTIQARKAAQSRWAGHVRRKDA